jgi:cytochrome P450
LRLFPFLDACARRYPDAFTIRLPAMPAAVVFYQPDAVKEVFSASADNVHAGEANAVLRPFLGDNSLLLLDGAEHLRQRKLLLPPFHGERMSSYGKRMLEITEASLARWPEGRTFPVHEKLQEITFDVILRVVFGIEEGDLYTRMRERFRDILLAGMMNPWLLLPALQRDLGPWSPWGRFVRLRAEADELLYGEIRRRRAAPADGKDDILSLLLKARDEEGKPLSDLELRDELVTLLVAGHETTATALSWALRWILASPALEARLVRELEENGGLESIQPDRIMKLPLLDATVREVLRLQPVVPIIGRVLKRPMRVGGWDLDAGTPVLLSIYLVQRRPELYPDPTRFDPDRFLRQKFSLSEWFPFGGGFRRCIGMAFALFEMKMVLASVLSRTVLRLPRVGRIREVRRGITIAPSGGMPVILEGRRNPKARITSSAGVTSTRSP